jgi:uncharacterized protein (DUF305 family)
MGGSGETPGVPSRNQLIALVAAGLFLAASVGYVAGHRPERGAAADVGFLQDMIAHHEQAIEMSRSTLGHDLPAGVASFVVEVVADQQYEIGVMETTLRRWGRPPNRADGTVMGWMGHAMPAAEMPGLATDDQLRELAAARGDEAASLWLTLMTTHHRGGASMATEAAERVHDGDVRALARRMARNQTIEIEEYARVRARLGL